MVVLSAEQIHGWDNFTMDNESIASIDLMERASLKCVEWIESNGLLNHQFAVYCGKGNNGGDGLAIGRLLHEKGCQVEIYILEFGHLGTHDFQQNLQRLHALPVNIHFLQPGTNLPEIPDETIVVDALLGTGINRAADGLLAAIIQHINASKNIVISIDLPSGMFCDIATIPNTCIHATVTLSFQCFKPAFLVAENASFFGKLFILDIGLANEYLSTITPEYELMDNVIASGIIRPRPPFAHKGNFGHALLFAGSEGKMGAAILAAKACLRTGAALLTCMVPQDGLAIIQTALPESMAIVASKTDASFPLPSLDMYTIIGAGPGIGIGESSAKHLHEILKASTKPMVIDADALNILSKNAEWLNMLQPFSILTPHPKEFDRIAGLHDSDFARISTARRLSKKYQLIIILKGHRTLIAMPGGRAWFNTSGNASMAKGGSGDVLTGMITGLLSRGYAPEQAALLGVYLHGLAGELASDIHGMESVLASDIVENIGKAFKALENK